MNNHKPDRNPLAGATSGSTLKYTHPQPSLQLHSSLASMPHSQRRFETQPINHTSQNQGSKRSRRASQEYNRAMNQADLQQINGQSIGNTQHSQSPMNSNPRSDVFQVMGQASEKQICEARKKLCCECRFTNDQLRKQLDELRLCSQENQQIKTWTQRYKIENQRLKETLMNVNSCMIERFRQFKVVKEDDLVHGEAIFKGYQESFEFQSYKHWLQSVFNRINDEMFELQKSQLQQQYSLWQSRSLKISAINGSHLQEGNKGLKIKELEEQLAKQHAARCELQLQVANQKEELLKWKDQQNGIKCLQLQKESRSSSKIEALKKEVVSSLISVYIVEKIAEISCKFLMDPSNQENWKTYWDSLKSAISSEKIARKNQIDELKKQCQRLKTANTQKENQLTNTRIAEKSFAQQKSKLQQHLAKIVEKADGLQKAKEQLQNQVQLLLKEIGRLQDQLKNNYSAQEKLTSQKQQQSQLLVQKEQQKSQLQTQIDRLTLSNQELSQEKEKIEEQIFSKSQQITALKEQAGKQKIAKQQMEMKLSQLKMKLIQRQNSIEGLRKEKQLKESEIEVSENQIAQLNQDLAALQRQKKQLQANSENLSREKQKLNQDCKLLTEKNTNDLEQIKRLSLEIQSKNGRINQISKELQQTRTNLHQYFNQSVYKQGELQKKTSQIQQIQQQRSRLSTDMNSRIRQLQHVIQTLQQTTKKDCDRIREDFTQRWTVCQQQAKQANSLLSRTKEQLRSSQEETKRLANQITILKRDLQQKVNQISQKDQALKIQEQNYRKSQVEDRKMIENLKQEQNQTRLRVQSEYKQKIKQLQEKHKQNNLSLLEIKEVQLHELKQSSQANQERLKKDHNQVVQRLQLRNTQLLAQAQANRRTIASLEQVACKTLTTFSSSIDRIRNNSNNEEASSGAQYDALLASYQKLKAENGLLICKLQLKKQETKLVQSYLQKCDSECLQKTFHIVKMQATVQEHQAAIKSLNTLISVENEKAKKVLAQKDEQFEALQKERQKNYKESYENLAKTFELRLQSQQIQSSAEIQSLKAIIEGLKQVRKVKSTLEESKSQSAEDSISQMIERQATKQGSLQQKITQLNKDVANLTKQLQQTSQKKQDAYQKLRISQTQLQQATKKEERLQKMIENYLNSASGPSFQQTLQKLQLQSQIEQPVLNLFISNIASNFQRVMLSNRILQSQKINYITLLRSMDTQNTNYKAQVERLIVEVEQQRDIVLQLQQKQMDERRSKQQGQNAEKNQARARIVEIEAQLQKYRNDVQRLQLEIKKKEQFLKQSLNGHFQQRTNLLSIIDTLKKQQAESKNTYQRLKSEKVNRQQQLNQEVNKLKVQKNNLQQQVDQYRSLKKDINKRSNDESEKIASYEAQIKNLKISLTQSAQNSKSLQKMVSQLALSKKELQSKLELQTNKKASLGSNKEKSQTEGMKKQIMQLKDQLNLIEATKNSLESQVRSLERMLAGKQQQLQIQRTTNQKLSLKIKEVQEKSLIKVGSSLIRSVSPPVQQRRINVEISKIRETSPRLRQVVEQKKPISQSKVLFGCDSILDHRGEEKQFLLKSIAEHLDKKCLSSNRLFAMDEYSKFRAFNLILNKTNLLQQNYLYLFRNKGTNNSDNIFAFVTCKTNNRNAPINGLLVSLTKRKAYPRRPNFDTKIEAARFQYSGELVMGGTLKIKPNEKRLQSLATKEKYFEVKKNSEIFDQEVVFVELSEMEIHQIQLQ